MGAFRAYLELCRPKNLVLAGATVPLGAMFALESNLQTYPFVVVVCHTVAVLAFTAAGNTMNDIKDVEIDRTAHPSRPLPSGLVSIQGARTFSILLWCASLVLHIMGLFNQGSGFSSEDGAATVIYVLAILLMMTYDHGPATKDKGFIGNIVISLLVAAVILYGAAGVGSIWKPYLWWIFGTVFFVNLARECVKDCLDMESDRGKRMTLPMKIGKEKTRMWAYVFIMLGLVCLYMPFWRGPFIFGQLIFQSPALLLLMSLNGPLFKGEDEIVVSRIRIGMLLGLVGFCLAVLM
ncbi:MAG: geranylgeranylglycerol-phosphate geranylgeranyltransferase [archaeon]|nr:geranylgeranylglycerol-phosphate geranylgeranyltransferase [archaeon]